VPAQATVPAQAIVPAQAGGPFTLPRRPRRRLARRLSERLAERRPRLWSVYQELKGKARTDLENYYSCDVARDLLLSIAAASVMANTSIDQDFQDWYQDDVRSSGTADFFDAWDTLGDGRIVVPVYVGIGILGKAYDETPCGHLFGEWGLRTGRGYLVGAPPMVFLQFCLGASRPGESDKYESRWKPFDDGNSVCGHGFISAVPFITAAKMTDRPLLKGAFYLGSTVGSWARIDRDAHYLSQVCLGWWMAYLACDVVAETDRQDQQLTLTPVITPEMSGVGALYEW
jgi:hypothetical protein